MKLSILAGATSQTVNVFIQDSASTTGTGKTGLVFNTSSLTAYYALPKAAAVAITLATLAAVTSAYSSGGFKEIDATNMPGWYRFDIPDAALASGRFVSIHLQGAAGMAPCPVEIELTAWNNQDGVRGGMTALPNAAAGANTGLPVVGTQLPLAMTGAGLVKADAQAGTLALTESYAALHAAPTLTQLLFEIRSLLAEKSVASVTLTANKIDGTTAAGTYTLNSATAPTTITRAT